MTTPPMPDAVILRTVMPNDYRYGHVYGYTRRQMQAYADARVREVLHEEAKPDNIKRAEYYGEGYADGWKAALEQAAQLCDAQHFGGDNDDDLGWTSCAANLAHAIRALIQPTE